MDKLNSRLQAIAIALANGKCSTGELRKTGQYKNTQTQAQRQNKVEKEKLIDRWTKCVTYSTRQIYGELESWDKSREKVGAVNHPNRIKQNMANSEQDKQKQNHNKAYHSQNADNKDEEKILIVAREREQQ